MQEFVKLLSSGGTVNGLFPVPVYKINIGRPFTEAELKAASPDFWRVRPGSDNRRSHSTDVLSTPALFNIRNFISNAIQDYVTNIIEPWENDFKLYITQSWINYNRLGEQHHKHFHSNSIISGSFYFDTFENDSITFYGDRRDEIHIMNKPNWWNMRRIGMPVVPGDLVIFNSNIEHGVERIQATDDKDRISLAFNTWFKGDIGSEEGLTKLVL